MTFCFGVDSDTDASALQSSTAAKAINRIFRGGKNRTRPAFVHKQFDTHNLTEDQLNVLLFGNYQGWFPYKKKKPGRKNGAIMSIGGDIFFIHLVNETFVVHSIFEGNEPKLFHTWFVQAEEWLYIQNGADRPIFWDGLTPSTARRSVSADNEMPIGTIMAYVHGRVFVSNAFDQIAASDIVYGSGITDSSATQRFTENLYWNEGGYFGQPTDLGEITGMIVLPRQDRNLTGQGELVIMSREGASAIEASVSRTLWKDSKIQTVTMKGRGCEAPDSLIPVNNDAFFRSDDGLASYQDTRQTQVTKLSFGKLSRQVNSWMRRDTLWLKRYASSIYFDNRILTTVSPEIELPVGDVFGNHRFNNGILSLDLDQASGVNGDGNFNWDGLFVGIRPCGFVTVEGRCFSFSHDKDGQNRIYEITRESGNDIIEGKMSKIQWSYVTKRFDWGDTGKSNAFEVKKLVGGEVWISNVPDRVSIGVDYRPDNTPFWTEAMPEKEFGSEFTGFTFSAHRYGRMQFGTPQTVCIPNSHQSDHASQFQFKVYGEGSFTIDRMRVGVDEMNDKTSPAPDCREDSNKTVLEPELDNDFSYNIVDAL